MILEQELNGRLTALAGEYGVDVELLLAAVRDGGLETAFSDMPTFRKEVEVILAQVVRKDALVYLRGQSTQYLVTDALPDGPLKFVGIAPLAAPHREERVSPRSLLPHFQPAVTVEPVKAEVPQLPA